ncbi:uncharacterized protein LOC113312821 [Papaver somniferum]|uniref:uncharacterized protein LOC113312821 n=1 Tax=Papaver somniferum TaxID=3469 RepID=UPI000E6F6D6C|nr:uncharacterized protein LOC113312821 [Papaver somniferum]
MITTPVLAFPDFNKPFELATDACDSGVGAVLMQDKKPIAFFSKGMGARFQAMSTYEKEIMSMVMSVTKWRSYLLGSKFTIYTDHQGIRHFLEQRVHSMMQQKWLTKLLGYNYELKYRKGSENEVADALSRVYLTEESNCNAISILQPAWLTEVQESYTQPLPVPDQAWKDVSMDFITGLPESEGREVILVVVDRFSKYSHFLALIHPYTAASVAKVFLDSIVKLHGLPKTIVSDRDNVFLSNFWQSLFSRMGTALHLSTTYHPQSEGQTERVNACLETYLRCMASFKRSKWVTWLLLAEWWFNTSFHTSPKLTLFEALYGYPPPQFGVTASSIGISSAADDYLQ